MMTEVIKNQNPFDDCTAGIAAVQDTLYVVSGKWKLPIIVELSKGPLRFKELQRGLNGVSAKNLSKELKDLEMNEFVSRTVQETSPVTVIYELTEYSESLKGIIREMWTWGLKHKKTLSDNSRKKIGTQA